MTYVVFLRGANVGGKNVFRPTLLVKKLAHLGIQNLGAAGTFVFRGPASQERIRRELTAALPFKPTLTILPGKLVADLVRKDPFAGQKFSKKRRGWVAVLAGLPKARPTLPIRRREG